MATEKAKHRVVTKASLWVAALLVSVGVIAILFVHYASHVNGAPAEKAFVKKLASAQHFRSTFPAQRQTIDLAKRSSLRNAALNAIGMEPRDVRGMATGDPVNVFAMLSHLGGFGEIVWVDHWSNFPIKLPPTKIPGQVVVPRRDAVRAALNAIEASGGCLIRAGANRYLVAKSSEKAKYETAIRALGWLHGSPPPWVKEDGDHHVNAKPAGPATGGQSIRSETNRTSSAAGIGR